MLFPFELTSSEANSLAIFDDYLYLVKEDKSSIVFSLKVIFIRGFFVAIILFLKYEIILIISYLFKVQGFFLYNSLLLH